MGMYSRTLFAAGLAASLFASPAAMADPSFAIEPLTQAELPGVLLHNPMSIKWEPEGNNKRVDIVESKGVPGGQAISFQVKRKSSKPWDINMRAPFDTAVSAGETVEIYFWARASKLPKGKDAGEITVALGRNEEPYDTVIDKTVMPTDTWTMYRVSGVAGADFPTSESDMGFNFGQMKQTIELGPFYAVNLGMVSASE